MYVFDLHCDVLHKLKKGNYNFFSNSGHISEENLIKGGYIAQCFAVYLPSGICGREAEKHFSQAYKLFNGIIEKSSVLQPSKNEKDTINNLRNKKISALLTCENAEFLNGNIEKINFLEALGLRVLGLIHNSENCIGFPNSKNKSLNNLPLKDFGKEVAERLNNTDIFIDISHLNYGGFLDVCEIYKKPILATHSACKNLYCHQRNLDDFQIKKIAQSGGLVGIVFFSEFLNGNKFTSENDIIYHIEHLINIGGEDTVALGTDFDGMECGLFIDNCGDMQKLADRLIKKFGFGITEKIFYKNALRLL